MLGVTLEPAQRVFLLIAADGVQPGTLVGGERELAREMFGEVDDVAPNVRATVAALKGADVGYSYMMGLRLLYRALTADVSDAAPGEIRPALCVAPDLRLARGPIRIALGFAEQHPAIRRLIESSTSDGFVLMRDGGRRTSVECLPASVGGRATRGRRYLEVVLDEACFFRDSSSGAVNDRDILRSVATRTRDGTVWMGSTPWLETAQLMIAFRDNFGNPTNALAARLPTLLVRTEPRVIDLVTRAREQDPAGAATEFDCAPPVGAGQFFDDYAIGQAAVDGLPLVLERGKDTRAFAAIDAGFVHDATGGVIAHRTGDLIEIAEIFERKPAKGKPLVPSVVIREFAQLAKKHGVTRVFGDVHYAEAMREGLRAEGLTFAPAPGGHQGKAEMFGAARELIHAGRVRWSAGHARLTQQAREVISRPMAGGGIQIMQPRRKGGHGDILSAAVLALWAARAKRKSFAEALAEPGALERAKAMLNGLGMDHDLSRVLR
jgi:hypothetical protein